MVCSVVAEVSSSTQKNILGIKCSGYQIHSTCNPSFENVFSLPNRTIEELANVAQLMLENLRSKWPVSASPSCWSPLIQRHVCFLNFFVLFSFLLF